MPELSLSLDLDLHDRVVGILDAFQSFLDSREQVDDLLLAEQDLAVRGDEVRQKSTCSVTIGGRGTKEFIEESEVKQSSDLRWVYRSLRTLSWFWTVCMMAFTISELSLLTSGSGTERSIQHTLIRCLIGIEIFLAVTS